jgi:hypothetical protein
MAILNGAEHYLVAQTCCGRFYNNTTKSLSWVNIEGLFLRRFMTGFTLNIHKGAKMVGQRPLHRCFLLINALRDVDHTLQQRVYIFIVGWRQRSKP